MKLQSIFAFIIITIFFSCGSKKAAVNKKEFINDINSYVSKVNTDKSLKTEVTEGALTDAEGFKDIGTFKYTVFFDENTKELFKIENVEKTDNTISETYYFQDNEFVFVKFNKIVDGQSKLYNVSTKDETSENLNFYKDKAERFQKAFKKTH